MCIKVHHTNQKKQSAMSFQEREREEQGEEREEQGEEREEQGKEREEQGKEREEQGEEREEQGEGEQEQEGEQEEPVRNYFINPQINLHFVRGNAGFMESAPLTGRIIMRDHFEPPFQNVYNNDNAHNAHNAVAFLMDLDLRTCFQNDVFYQ